MEDKQILHFSQAKVHLLRLRHNYTDAHLFPLGASEAHYRLNKDLFEVSSLVKFIMLNSR